VNGFHLPVFLPRQESISRQCRLNAMVLDGPCLRRATFTPKEINVSDLSANGPSRRRGRPDGLVISRSRNFTINFRPAAPAAHGVLPQGDGSWTAKLSSGVESRNIGFSTAHEEIDRATQDAICRLCPILTGSTIARRWRMEI